MYDNSFYTIINIIFLVLLTASFEFELKVKNTYYMLLQFGTNCPVSMQHAVETLNIVV